eukprot:scaffold1525_cov142-Cylindrotheca_fusiformis.AAC.174
MALYGISMLLEEQSILDCSTFQNCFSLDPSDSLPFDVRVELGIVSSDLSFTEADGNASSYKWQDRQHVKVQ